MNSSAAWWSRRIPALKGRRVVGEINAGMRAMRNVRRRSRAPLPDAHRAWNPRARRRLRRVPAPPRRKSDSRSPIRFPMKSAVFVEPLAAAYEIFAQIHLARNHRIAVLGDGRLGALVALALKGRRICADRRGASSGKTRAARASRPRDDRRGISLREKFDVVIDCSGRGPGFARAIELVRPRGTIILKSTAAAAAEINLAPIVVNEITVVGSRCGRFAPALDALAAGRSIRVAAHRRPSSRSTTASASRFASREESAQLQNIV